MYSEQAIGCLSVDLVLTTGFFLESVEDGLTNVFITEKSLYNSYPRFQLTKLQGWKSKVGIKMIEINNSRLVIHIHNI